MSEDSHFPDTAHVDAYRRKRMWAMTPEERSRACQKLTKHAYAQLQRNPEAMKAFLQRNHRNRKTLWQAES